MAGFDFDAYKALPIAGDSALDAAELPSHWHLQGVPCVSRPEAYCQSTSLQVVAEWRSRRRDPIGFYNWLMGFTYGAGHLKHSLVFLPFSDPEAGLRLASPPLGLSHRYRVTDDPELYQRAIQAALVGGSPLRVMVDSATLRGHTGYFSPHSIVLVGYGAEGVLYYETRAPSAHSWGQTGQLASWDLLLRAARRVSETYRYPWVLQFTQFGTAPAEPLDAAAIWARNGRLLIGEEAPWYSSGSFAPRSLAAELVRREGRDLGDLKVFLQYGVDTRRDNAAYLREGFAPEPRLSEVARALAQVAELYSGLHALLSGPEGGADVVRFRRDLESIAELELAAGQAIERCDVEPRVSA